MDHLIRPESQRFFALPVVLGDADYTAHRRETPQRRDGKEAYAPRTDQKRRVFRAGVRFERGVNGAGERLNCYGGLFRERIRDAV